MGKNCARTPREVCVRPMPAHESDPTDTCSHACVWECAKRVGLPPTRVHQAADQPPSTPHTPHNPTETPTPRMNGRCGPPGSRGRPQRGKDSQRRDFLPKAPPRNMKQKRGRGVGKHTYISPLGRHNDHRLLNLPAHGVDLGAPGALIHRGDAEAMQAWAQQTNLAFHKDQHGVPP